MTWNEHLFSFINDQGDEIQTGISQWVDVLKVTGKRNCIGLLTGELLITSNQELE